MSAPITHLVNFYLTFRNAQAYQTTEKIVAWLNRCFDKNTNRLFVVGDLKPADQIPQYGAASMVLPHRSFRLHLSLQPYAPANTQFMGNGDHLISMPWNGDKLDTITLNRILHEAGHAFGVAIGEYYGCRTLKDFTGVQPELKVSALFKDDYWNKRPEWLRDPMLLGNVEDPTWSPLSALVINSGKWRIAGPPCPNLDAIPVASEFKNATVAAYRMDEQQPIWTGTTDEDGLFVLPWGAESNGTAVSSDQFRKFVFNGAAARGLSIFDVQYAALRQSELPGQLNYTVKLW